MSYLLLNFHWYLCAITIVENIQVIFIDKFFIFNLFLEGLKIVNL